MERLSCILLLCIAAFLLGAGLQEFFSQWLRLGHIPFTASTAEIEGRRKQWQPDVPAFWGNDSALRIQTTIDPSAWSRAQLWAMQPDSVCFQGHNGDVNLTIVTAGPTHVHPDVLTCIRLNRVLMALQQHARYCHFTPLDPTRAPAWSKLLAMKQALTLSPYALWMDGDAMFARFDRPVLRTLLHLSQGKDALLSSEFTVPLHVTEKQLDTQQASVNLNSGVMLLRSTAWSRSFLDRVYHDAPYTSHWGAIFGYFDQAAITHFQRTHAKEWVEHVRVTHFRHWNGWKKVLGQSMIYHAAGGQGVADKYVKVLNMCVVLTCKHVPQKCWHGSIFKSKDRDHHARERSGQQGTAGA